MVSSLQQFWLPQGPELTPAVCPAWYPPRMTYADAIQFLYSLRWFGAKFGLENTLKRAERAGNPQN